MGKKEIKKVLFYTHTPRFFRTTLVGHLFEISQIWPVVLLSEELDDELNKIIQDKTLFPKLQEIIPVRQFTGQKESIFKKNKYLCNLAKELVVKFSADIVISASDMHSLFELYLMRFSKRADALNIVFQAGNVVDSSSLRKSVDLINANLRFPDVLPIFFRLFLAKCRKYFGHFLYYYILPLLVFQKPFFGKASYILRTGNAGMRDADYSVVFSERDKNIFIKDGVPENKVYVLKHPLERKTREFFKKTLLKEEAGEDKKIVTLLLPSEEIGFRNRDFSLISKEERLAERRKIIKLVAQKLDGWQIFIKPHPNVKNFPEIKKIFEGVSGLIRVIDPSDSVDKYVRNSQVVVGLPKANTTVLFSASLVFPEKVIMALDFDKELLGDFYKDFQGIEYIDNENKFISLLEKIFSGEYKKFYEKNKKNLADKEFENVIELIDNLNNKK
jgi:hypothetical protein